MNQMELFNQQMPESDLAILKQATSILHRYFDGKPKQKQSRGWRVRQKTRDFMDEVQWFYRKEWVHRYDEELMKIEATHNVPQLSDWLKMYEKGGLIEVVRVNNKNRTIIKFRFL